MRLIISPAKIMKDDFESFPVQSKPEFIEQAQELVVYLQQQSDATLQMIFNTKNKLFEQNKIQLKNMNLSEQLTPAIIAFSGLQYQYMAPDIFSKQALEYVQDHVRILSALYGILKPFDGIKPYRLEMGSKMPSDFGSLYSYWGNKIYKSLYQNNDAVINLASNEYSRMIKKYVQKDQKFITIKFLNKYQGKYRIIGTYSKIARGSMIRYVSENQIENYHELKNFHEFGYKFDEKLSNENDFVFKTDFEFKKK